jgi:DNA polymerase II large subunit
MGKKKSIIQEVIENVIEISTEKTVINLEANVEKHLGRPVNPESARQKRIAELEQKRLNGELRKGRPIVEGSKRQQTLEARAAKISEVGELKRGRPVNGESKRQQVLAARAAKLSEGGELKKGRPINPESKRQQVLMVKAAKTV